MRILVLSRYSRLGASSRLRFYQYLPGLESAGIQFTVAPILGDHYINNLYSGHRKPLISVARGYFERLLWIIRAKNFDVIWLEKEFFPWLPAWLELNLLPKNTKLVVDYDDAVFHQFDQHPSAIVRKLLGTKIDAVMKRANIVIVGNRYLANRATDVGARQIVIIPTVVNTDHYYKATKAEDKIITIGWIGSPANTHYLHLIAPAINQLIKSKNIRFVAVGANADQLVGLPISVVPWSETDEIKQIQKFDIGIMPLPDQPFERGKCGYKLIQYMACGIPVVATPLGANVEIVRDGIDGFWATTQADWVESMSNLIDDAGLRARMGNSGRLRVESSYSLRVTLPLLERELKSLLD